MDGLRAVVEEVPDPELPVLTIGDLGVVRDVRVEDDVVTVDITPTYSGCPATETIRADVEDALRRAGVERPVVNVVLAPAWTTDWISAQGRRRLADAGIAPPPARRTTEGRGPVLVSLSVRCPQCGSGDTTRLSAFGATPCMSMWRCETCREPFDAVKAH